MAWRSEDLELLVVPLPRGRVAAAFLHHRTETVTTNHMGLLGTLFLQGVEDFDGRTVFPEEGHRFMVALYDHLILRGYRVRWIKSVSGLGYRNVTVD
jgi:hypothetical protein